MPTSLVLVGVGLHAEHAYLPLIREREAAGRLRLTAVVDVAGRGERVRRVLRTLGFRAPQVILLDEAQAAGKAAVPALDALADAGLVDGAVVATDPRHHLHYLEWAALHGLPALVDKPLTARALDFTDAAAQSLLDDFHRVGKVFADVPADATMMVPRRCHPGFVFLRDTLHSAVCQLGVPLTHVDVYHSSGYWNMPDEFLTRENHPYRHGYGALLHSGYHFVDLAAQLLDLNRAAASEVQADRIEVGARYATPADVLAQVPRSFYERAGIGDGLDEAFSADGLRSAARCGETDLQLTVTALRGGRTLTLGGLRLLETGTSHRSWRNLPADTYKGNGKFAQDRISAHVGHLLGLHAWDESDGTGRRFVVEVTRNSTLIGGDAVTRRTFEPVAARPGGPAESLSVQGKRTLFQRWLDGRTEGLGLDTHETSIRLLVAAYQAMFRHRRGEAALASFLPAGAGTEAW